MSETTPRLGLPYLIPGQAQKEATHNEALAIADALIQCTVTAIRNDPPVAPAAGAAWIVGTAPTGAWSGRADAVAWWTEGGWRFTPAIDGMAAWVAAAAAPARFQGGGWTIAERLPAITAPAGGTTVDSEARAALTAILVALRSHHLIAS